MFSSLFFPVQLFSPTIAMSSTIEDVEYPNEWNCVVCLELMKEAFNLSPCNHKVCGDCAPRLGSCPLCKCQIESRGKDHFVSNTIAQYVPRAKCLVCLSVFDASANKQHRRPDAADELNPQQVVETEHHAAFAAAYAYILNPVAAKGNEAVRLAVDAMVTAASPSHRLRAMCILVALHEHQAQSGDAVKYAYEAFVYAKGLDSFGDVRTCVNHLVTISALIERLCPCIVAEQHNIIKLILQRHGIRIHFFESGAPVCLVEQLAPGELGKHLSAMLLCGNVNFDVFA